MGFQETKTNAARLLVAIVCTIALAACAAYKLQPMERPPGVVEEGSSPVNREALISGVCLSGGGYRAMLMHAGLLMRMNELGLLKEIRAISAVSGGAITAGALVMAWPDLEFDDAGVATNFDEAFVEPLRRLASSTIDWPSVISGMVVPGRRATDFLVGQYDRKLFGGALLDAGEGPYPRPTVVLNATNLHTGQVWSFSSLGTAGDASVGYYAVAGVPLAMAVAASSAYPPILSPIVVDISDLRGRFVEFQFGEVQGEDGTRVPSPGFWGRVEAGAKQEWARRAEELDFEVELTDGGVRDNLGTKHCLADPGSALISDASTERPIAGGSLTWLGQAMDVISTVHGRAELDLRRRIGCHSRESWTLHTTLGGGSQDDAMWLPTCLLLIDEAGLRFQALDRGMGTHRSTEAVRAMGAIEFQRRLRAWQPDERFKTVAQRFDVAQELASIDTRLAALDEPTQEHLLNYGYFLGEGAMAQWFSREMGRRFAKRDAGDDAPLLDTAVMNWATGSPRLPYALHPRLEGPQE